MVKRISNDQIENKEKADPSKVYTRSIAHNVTEAILRKLEGSLEPG